MIIFKFDETLKDRNDSNNIYLLETEVGSRSAVKVIYVRYREFFSAEYSGWLVPHFLRHTEGNTFKNEEWILSLNDHINLEWVAHISIIHYRKKSGASSVVI